MLYIDGYVCFAETEDGTQFLLGENKKIGAEGYSDLSHFDFAGNGLSPLHSPEEANELKQVIEGDQKMEYGGFSLVYIKTALLLMQVAQSTEEFKPLKDKSSLLVIGIKTDCRNLSFFGPKEESLLPTFENFDEAFSCYKRKGGLWPWSRWSPWSYTIASFHLFFRL